MQEYGILSKTMSAVTNAERNRSVWVTGLSAGVLIAGVLSLFEGLGVDKYFGYSLPPDSIDSTPLDPVYFGIRLVLVGISGFVFARNVTKLRLENPEERHIRLSKAYDDFRAELVGEPLPDHADAVFIPGLAGDVIKAYSLFDHVVELVRTGRVKYVIYSDRDWRGTSEDGKDPSVVGAEWYRQELIRRGVPPEKFIPAGQEAQNTREQTDELIITCKDRGFKSIIMASVTYHNPRIVSTAIASMAEQGYAVSLHCLNAPLIVDPKTYEVTKSQGKGRQTLDKEIAADRERGIDYLDNGTPVGDKLKWTRPRGYGAPPDMLKMYQKFKKKNDMAGWQAYLKKLTGEISESN